MSKTKYLLVAAAGLMSFLSNGCVSTITGGYRGQPGGVSEKSIIYEPGSIFGDNESTCRDLGKLLNNEFDDFKCFESCGKENENKDCERWDLVIRGYNESGNVYRPVWGVNIPNVCNAYNQGRWAWEVLVGKDIYLEMADGSVVPYRMNHNVSDKLNAFMGLRAQMNTNCDDSTWMKLMKKHGPTNQPGKKFNHVR
ncbi:MAG: hypothetical protein WCV90_00750 [Candidatus Woesearchaeota archaeon]|jgi:hypothetical protein